MRELPSTLADYVDSAHVALIVWDMQEGLGGKAFNREEVSRSCNSLTEAADQSNIPVFWSRHSLPPVDQMTPAAAYTLARRQGVSTYGQIQSFMELGSEEWQFIEECRPKSHHIVLDKSTPSFFIGTPLDQRLRGLEVRTLVLTGVATEIGIDFTTRHALALGYLVVVAEDAVGSYTQSRNEHGLSSLRALAEVVSAADILEVWRNA